MAADMLRNVGAVWNRAGAVQRIVLLAALLLCAGAGWLLIDWARRPSLALLYGGLDAEEAALIADVLRDEGVAYKVAGGGSQIHVPANQRDELRMKLAGKDLPNGGSQGYKILDSDEIGISPFKQQVNYLRAVEGELAKSVRFLDGVASARVHIAKAREQLFGSAPQPVKATVVLKLQPGRQLSGRSVAAIVNLIAGAVAGLTPEKVVVVDSQRNLLTPEGSQGLGRGLHQIHDTKAQIEQDLVDKAMGILATALGPNRAEVKVNVQLDTTTVRTREVKPTPGAKLTEKTRSRSPASPAGNGAPARASGNESEETTEYSEPGTTEMERVELAGKVTSKQVAVLVDLNPRPVAAPEAKEAEAEKPKEEAPSMKVEEVEELVSAALGLDTTAGTDRITVKNVKFGSATSAAPLLPEPNRWEFWLGLARNASLGVLVLGVLLMLRMLRGPKRARAAQEALEGGTPAGAGGLLPGEAAELDPSALRARITSALQENPEEVKRLFLSWVSNEQGG